MHNRVTSHLWLKSALHASSHPCMCTCVLRCGWFSLHPSPSSTSFHRFPSSPSRCSPQSSTRGPGPTPCATSAWGPWPLLTTRHPSHGIYFIDLEDKEFKETIKNARKKLETSVALVMPSKIMKNCGSGGSDKNKTKLACILEANESTRMRMGNSEPPNHEDHIAGKGENSLIAALQFGSQIYSYASSYENSGSNSSGLQGMGKTGENFGVELDESQK